MKATLNLPKHRGQRPEGLAMGDKVTVEHIRNGKVIYSDEENDNGKSN
jgi:hypothetical protein